MNINSKTTYSKTTWDIYCESYRAQNLNHDSSEGNLCVEWKAVFITLIIVITQVLFIWDMPAVDEMRNVIIKVIIK